MLAFRRLGRYGRKEGKVFCQILGQMFIHKSPFLVDATILLEKFHGMLNERISSTLFSETSDSNTEQVGATLD